VGFFGAWLTTFTAPYFINPSALNWGPKYGYIWFPSCLLSAAFIYFYLPELKNRTLEEIDEMFEARLPARKFRGHVCNISTIAEKANGPDYTLGTSLEKPVMEGVVEVIEHVHHV